LPSRPVVFLDNTSAGVTCVRVGIQSMVAIRCSKISWSMTPASGVIGCSGPATRGIPSMKRMASCEPSGEKREPEHILQLRMFHQSTTAGGCGPDLARRERRPGRSAIKAMRFTIGGDTHATFRIGRPPSHTEIVCEDPSEATVTVSFSFTMYATRVPSGERATSLILLACGMESRTAAACESRELESCAKSGSTDERACYGRSTDLWTSDRIFMIVCIAEGVYRPESPLASSSALPSARILKLLCCETIPYEVETTRSPR